MPPGLKQTWGVSSPVMGGGGASSGAGMVGGAGGAVAGPGMGGGAGTAGPVMTGGGGSSAQAAQFRSAFQGQIALVNAHLQYTAGHAETSKHQPLAGKRDQMYSKFNGACGKIDPEDESKAQSAIGAVLSALGALVAAAATLHTNAQAAFDAWTAKEPIFEGEVSKVEELEAWEDAAAATLRQIAGLIRDQANVRKYKQAVAAVDSLMSKLAPIYAEYLRQKAAKEEYEPLYDGLKPRLTEAFACEYETLAPQADAISAKQTTMETSAADKNYVQALELCRDLQTDLTSFEEDRARIDQEKQGYQLALDELQQPLVDASVSQFASLTDLQTPLVEIPDEAAEMAAEEQFVEATARLGDLRTALAAYNDALTLILVQQATYESAKTANEPHLAEVSASTFTSLQDLRAPIEAKLPEAETLAAEEKFEQATAKLVELESLIAAFLDKHAELEAKKAACEQGFEAQKANIATLEASPFKTIEPMRANFASYITQIETGIQSEAFDETLTYIGQLEQEVAAALIKHMELEAQKAAFDASFTEAKGTIAAVKKHKQSKHYTAEIGALDAKLTAAKAKADTKAGTDDFVGAQAELKGIVSESSEIKIKLDLISSGVDKAKAEMKADVSQELIDSGIPRDKAVEIGKVMETGGSGTVEDAKLVAKDMADLPAEYIKALNEKGTTVVACRGDITDHRTDLKGVQPRGWPDGKTWEDVPGVHSPGKNEVVVATNGHGTPGGAQVPPQNDGHGSYSLVAHEVMHAYDESQETGWLGMGEAHDEDSFEDAHEADESSLGDYYTQGGGAGLEETYAESAARYYAGDPTLKTQWPHLWKYWDDKEKAKNN